VNGPKLARNAEKTYNGDNSPESVDSPMRAGDLA